MLPSPLDLRRDAAAMVEPGDVDFTMEMLELELTLDGRDDTSDDFADRVRTAAADLKGAYLFDLPASGLIDNCIRIAILRIPRDHGQASETIYACLETDGVAIRIQKPDERTRDLQNFAQAFVEVFQRI